MDKNHDADFRRLFELLPGEKISPVTKNKILERIGKRSGKKRYETILLRFAQAALVASLLFSFVRLQTVSHIRKGIATYKQNCGKQSMNKRYQTGKKMVKYLQYENGIDPANL